MNELLELGLEQNTSLGNIPNFCDQVFPVLIAVHPGLKVLKMHIQKGSRRIVSATLLFCADCRLREALLHLLPVCHILKDWGFCHNW